MPTRLLPVGSSLARLVLATTALLLVLSWPLAAQDVRIPARPLTPGHWAYDFSEILHAQGAPEVWPVWQEPIPAGPLYEAFEAAAASSRGSSGAADTWTSMLRSETGLAPRQVARFGLSAGFESSEVSLVPERGGYVEGIADVAVSSAVAFWAEGGVASEASSGELISGGLAARFGAAQVLAGRIRSSTSQGSTKILLAGRKSMDGVLVGSARPFEVPVVGRTTAHIFVAPSISTPNTESAWFGSFGLAFEPHPAIRIGAYRTVRFAGDGISETSAGDVVNLLAWQGADSGFDDNQGEFALRVRYRAWGQPIATYVSLGYEDFTSLWEDPALVAGTLIPFDVGSGVLTARYEYQAFGDRARWCGSCEEGHHRWYNQREYGTYTVDDVPLGSSLGGYGARHQVEMSYWGEIPVRFTGVGFVEDRERTNILYDRWPGTRQGVGMKIAGRPRPGWELELAGLAAWSEGESEGGLNLVVRMFDVLTNPMGAAR